MNPSLYRIRRATVDDLKVLRPLWQSINLAPAEMERRLTEFQVAVDGDGKVIGAIGFLMAGRHGRIHSEIFSEYGAVDAVRPLFWERLQVLAANHGILRLWTQEDAPFWKQNGLVSPSPESLKKLPPQWASLPGNWLTLQLKNEEAITSVEKEVALLMKAEKERMARAVGKAKRLKTVFTILVFIIGFSALALALYFYQRQKQQGLLPQ
jgi:hypothetical protein